MQQFSLGKYVQVSTAPTIGGTCVTRLGATRLTQTHNDFNMSDQGNGLRAAGQHYGARASPEVGNALMKQCVAGSGWVA